MNILLAYVSYPITTAAYIESALRKIADVKTIGPRLPEKLITQWKLENMGSPVLPQEIEVEMDVDMSHIEALIGDFKADLYLWVESVPGYFPKNLERLQCAKACYLIDTYSNFSWHKEWAKNFDYVFLADLSFLQAFRELGINAFWLPLACDPSIHHNAGPRTIAHDISFVGTVSEGTERYEYINRLSSHFNLYFERSFLKQMSSTFSASKIVFNNAVGKTDLNMRFFEVLASGALLLSDMAESSGQDILFMPQHEYALYKKSNILDVATYYLKDDLARQSVAKSGQDLVLAGHTYLDRMRNMLEVIGQRAKSTMGPHELRDYALANLRAKASEKGDGQLVSTISVNSVSRSFIIPVLDYSPASSFNINTLLEDLKDIGGEVIVIFNNETVANEIKNHPRIDHYVIMKANIGVARAWNIGLDICRTDYAFILNADLHIQKSTIEELQHGLKTLPDAAIVGPQGAYFNFEEMKDYVYLDKGKFSNVMEVDAVSGFLFGVCTRYFDSKQLKFENQFTPCYFEEWDLGLQIKQAGLKAYVLPVTGYDHQWSGSIRSYRQIQYYDRAETATQIQMRNGHLFQQKWKEIAKLNNDEQLLESSWLKILIVQFEIAISKNLADVADNFIKQLAHYFPQNSAIQECRAVFAKHFPGYLDGSNK